MKKPTPIFSQLIFNIIIPVVLALIFLAILNYYRTNKLLKESNQTKSEIITDEIRHVLQFQDVALGLLEARMNERMERLSNKIVEEVETYISKEKDVKNLDLNMLREELGMKPNFEDIYIINRKGIVVNTTFKKDLHLNFFEFGEEHKKLLLNILDNNKFVSERFAIESNTRRLKKYTYQPTETGSYIVELGFYNVKADDITQFIRQTLLSISSKQASISGVDLFIGEDNPFALNKEINLEGEHQEVLKRIFKNKGRETIIEKKDGRTIYYEYIYMGRQKTRLYKGSVIRIINDRTDEITMLRNELIQVIIIFILIIVVVIFLIYRKTKVITEPIRNLVNHVNRITNGHLDERIDILGSKEITNLSQHFNVMIATIQEYYNELEEKVRERTAEISRQKEKIEKQNKHITDSINYAQNIQKAVLPPFDYISKSLHDFFILFRPRDIVSGDFYWFASKNNHVVIAAVDCTGHGVPGAFMSMLGVSLLNEIVNKLEKLDSDVILNELRSNVIKSLRQTGKEGEAKDGMDMALCIINFENLKLQYSGAHNHLYHVREKELEVYKADRVPISFNPYTIDKEYTKHELDLKKGDTFYIFSDGYTDQFGGPKNKKFGIKRLKELFVRIQDKSMYEQKTILEQNLDEWKKDMEQIDDILVIGFKI